MHLSQALSGHPSFCCEPPSNVDSTVGCRSWAILSDACAGRNPLQPLQSVRGRLGMTAEGAHACMHAQVYRRLQYFVTLPGKKQVGEDGKRQRLELLKGITGVAVPGQLTALMGGSGAGKASHSPTAL